MRSLWYNTHNGMIINEYSQKTICADTQFKFKTEKYYFQTHLWPQKCVVVTNTSMDTQSSRQLPLFQRTQMTSINVPTLRVLQMQKMHLLLPVKTQSYFLNSVFMSAYFVQQLHKSLN